MSLEKKSSWRDASRTGNLRIRGIQRGYGQEDRSEVTTKAHYIIKDGKRNLYYKEYMEGGASQQVRLIIDDQQVILKKSGMGQSILQFKKGAPMPCHYMSPAGPMEMVSKTKKIRVRENEEALLLNLEYSLFMHDQLVSDYELEIGWVENS